MSQLTKTSRPTGDTVAHVYDPVGRLTKTDFSLAATADIGITYDSLGNATKITGPATELQYAHEGARMTKETYAWDARDKLTKVRKQPDGGSMADVAAYSYDSQGRRFQKIGGGVTKTYYQDGLTPVVEKTSAGAIYNQSVPGALGNVIDSNMTYYAYDRLGNVLATFTTAGAIYSAPVMDAFGNVLQGDKSGFHLTTKQYDPDVELYYFNARWYEPLTGRFMSRAPNPVRFEHPYSFSNNSPLVFSDVTGAWMRPAIYIARMLILCGLGVWLAFTIADCIHTCEVADQTLKNNRNKLGEALYCKFKAESAGCSTGCVADALGCGGVAVGCILAVVLPTGIMKSDSCCK